MNKEIINWYRATKSLIEHAKGREDHENVRELYHEWQQAIETMELACQGLKEQVARHELMIKSFSPEQVDFICYQIGDWYIEWQDKMWVKDKPNQHWLGRAKEQLKTMICGE